MSAVTRRRALTFTAAALAVPAAPALAVASNPDAKLLRLCAAHGRGAGQIDALQEPWFDHPIGPPPDVDAQIRHLVAVGWSLRRRIAQHRAVTLEGMAAKARIVEMYSASMTYGSLDPNCDEAIAYSLARDVQRMQGSAA